MDPLIQQSIVSLVELSRYRLGLICHHLVNQLESISKVNQVRATILHISLSQMNYNKSKVVCVYVCDVIPVESQGLFAYFIRELCVVRWAYP